MSTSPDPLASFSVMLRAALDDLLAVGAGSFVEMFAEDGVMEFPYTPPGGVARLEGRAALADYLPKVAGAIRFERMGTPIIHRTLNPEIVILEFAAEGYGVQTHLPYNQHYISVITVRAGHIVHYRDYWNPLEVLQATGGEQALAQAFQLQKGGNDASR